MSQLASHSVMNRASQIVDSGKIETDLNINLANLLEGAYVLSIQLCSGAVINKKFVILKK